MKKFKYFKIATPLEDLVDDSTASEHTTLLNSQRVRFEAPTPDQSLKKKRNSFLPLISILLFGIIYILPIFPNHPTAHTCLAIVFFICFLWISETIPPFASAYILPILAVFFQIGYDSKTHKRIPSSELATYFSSKFMDPVIFVFLGSLTMSFALSKLDITTRLSKMVLRNISPSPSILLLVLMMLNVFIASFLSNVASTTLVLSLALPIIHNLDPSDPYIKAILLGIAWSGNCGGMATLISSPQNVIAVHIISQHKIDVTFLQWLSFGSPVAYTLVLSFWGFLCARFIKDGADPIQYSLTSNDSAWTNIHTTSCIVTIITIAMWSLSDYIGWFMGHPGIAALIPVVYFFGSGILTLSEFNSFKWSTLVLLGGGLALGEAMKISGLLDLLAEIAKPYLIGVSTTGLLVALLIFEGIIASLLSSSTAASIMYPLIYVIGEGTGHAPLLIVLSSLMISGAQLFHISSFPNALVSGVCEINHDSVDKNGGQPFLKGIDFVINGWPTVLMGIFVISTLGYMLSSSIGL